MLCYLILFLIILIIFCNKNNLEFFESPQRFNHIYNNCNVSKNITNNLKCKKNQYCKDENNCNINDVLDTCGEDSINKEAFILNSSKLDKDINNRRLLNHLYSTFELNSELNTKTWCE